MPVTGMDRMPGSGLARGTLFDKELNVTEIDVPTITLRASIILEKTAENSYTITWTQPTGTDRVLSIPAMSANDVFIFAAATQTLSGKTLTSPAINTATIIGGTITAITDLDMTVGNKTILDTIGANTLTIGANNTTISIPGNLTISGTTTTVNTTTLNVADNLFYLNSDFTGSATQDSGFVIERGNDTNVAFVWDESADQFAMVTTNNTGSGNDITEIAYTHLRMANLTVAQIGAFTATGAINFGSQAMTAVNIDSGAIDGVTIGTNSVVTDLRVDDLQINDATISTVASNYNIILNPHGTGDVMLNADTVRVGDANSAATITTNGESTLTLSTNSGTNSGTIRIKEGADDDIEFATHGTGNVNVNADTIRVGDENANATITTWGTGDLILNTNAGTNSSSITIQDATNGSITLYTSGVGQVNIPNVNIDGGDISGVTISSGLTWTAAQNLNSQALTGVNIDSGAIDGTTLGANAAVTINTVTWAANQDFLTYNITTGGVLRIDTDSASTGTGQAGATGTLTMGVGGDLAMYHDSAHSYITNTTGDFVITTDGTNGAGIILDVRQLMLRRIL